MIYQSYFSNFFVSSLKKIQNIHVLEMSKFYKKLLFKKTKQKKLWFKIQFEFYVSGILKLWVRQELSSVVVVLCENKVSKYREQNFKIKRDTWNTYRRTIAEKEIQLPSVWYISVFHHIFYFTRELSFSLPSGQIVML